MFLEKVLLLAHDAHFGIHRMLRSFPKTRPNGLKFTRHTSGGQFGIVNPPEADKRSALYESISKSGQNRSQKTFYENIILGCNVISQRLFESIRC